MPIFEFNCDDCGKLWSLKVHRTGPHYCKSCIEKRRKRGAGPVQEARAAAATNPSAKKPSMDRRPSSEKRVSVTSGRNSGIRQDPERLQRVIDLFNEGKTYQTIADEFGVSDSRIQHIIKRLAWEGLVSGFPRRRGRRPG